MKVQHFLVGLCVVASAFTLGCKARQRREARQERAVENRPAEVRDDRRDRAIEDNTRWEKLGERMVTARADRDVIRVGAREGGFRRIKIAVEHSALEMFDIVVTFGNGETFSPNTRLVFGRNTTSRTIDLPGVNRIIRKVEFRYGNLPGGGRAQVELWAKN